MRAVAGVLHHLQAFSSSGMNKFEQEFKKALQLLPGIRGMAGGRRTNNEGKVSQKLPGP